MRNSPNRHSPRETRYLDFVSQSTCDIRHVNGEDNSAADALSRIVSLTATLCVDRLKQTLKDLQPPHSRSQQQDSHVPTVPQTCTHVFARRDAVRKPLQAPYDGSFKVISRSPKHFKIDLGTRTDTISIDRLKCAHMDTAISPTTSDNQPVHTLQSTLSSHRSTLASSPDLFRSPRPFS